MAQILISGRVWAARALLRAQLIEEGFNVEAYEDVQAAVHLLQASKTMPAVIIADLFDSANPTEDVESLARWAKLVPIWILAGHASPEAEFLEGHGFEKVIYRPIDVGKLVQEIKERLAV